MVGIKANEPRVMMRVPISFRNKVNDAAKERKMNATEMLEHTELIVNVA